jgi:alpha-L-rhamnosidase
MDMLKHGATTITERWNYEGDLGMNSHNHPVFGVVSGWMYRWLAGIRIDPEKFGYRHFVVAPETPEGLDWAAGSLETVRGMASVRWMRGRRGFKLDLQVPPSSEATVLFPGSESPDVIILEDGKPLAASPFVTPGPRDPLTGRATARVQSGSYRFGVKNGT